MQIAEHTATAEDMRTASRAAVARGVALLDEKVPGWAGDIGPWVDIADLDICVLGQLARKNVTVRSLIEARWNDAASAPEPCPACRQVHGRQPAERPTYRYYTAARALGLGSFEGSLGSPREYGFDSGYAAGRMTGVPELNEEWHRVITERKAAV